MQWASDPGPEDSSMDEAVVRFLSGTELMAHVPEDMLGRIATHAKVRRLNAGQVVYEQGSIAEFLYFINARRDP